jgi:holo-ACP synthase/triphosphoribosyl-dephospho-CoA synthase
MKTERITLDQMLKARERRAEIQKSMLGREDGTCLVCLTLNIAGDIKRTPKTEMLFRRGLDELDALGPDTAGSLIIDEPTGSEAFRLVRGDAARVKEMLEAVEDSFPAARLFDFDVLGRDGSDMRKLSREVARRCLVCGGPAAECARSRRHGIDAVRLATVDLLRGFCADTLADAAYAALLDELYTTPKPGLVDLASCGSHDDMDIPLLEKSAESLRTYFRDAAMMGMEGCDMNGLRQRGLKAEEDMFSATGGVNTHKGLIYSMGLLLAGTGMALEDEGISSGAAAHRAADLARQDAHRLLKKAMAEPATNGAKAYRSYGAKGAIGEASSGFPDALRCAFALRSYKDAVSSSEPDGDITVRSPAGVLAFCDTMAELEDTNLLHRGGKPGLEFAKSEASRIASIPDLSLRIRELYTLDSEMQKRSLSPGGCADMLALAYYLDYLDR